MATRKNRAARSTTRKGNKGNKDNKKVSLFAVYAFNAAADSPCARRKGCYWSYPRLPAGWHWIGRGTLHPLHPKGRDHSLKEEHFMGPLATREKTREILQKTFAALEPDSVAHFKIVNQLS